MVTRTMSRRSLLVLLLGVLAMNVLAAEPVMKGEEAPDFTLQSLNGKPVRLREVNPGKQVVLVVLRGWPGYQCPVCDRQVHDFIVAKAALGETGARVVFVYPGPADGLKGHAEEFKMLKGREWPEEFVYLLDPDYTMINAYHLRWDAPNETAYPSTFVLDDKGMIRFAKVSRSHGGRATVKEILAQLKM